MLSSGPLLYPVYNDLSSGMGICSSVTFVLDSMSNIERLRSNPAQFDPICIYGLVELGSFYCVSENKSISNKQYEKQFEWPLAKGFILSVFEHSFYRLSHLHNKVVKCLIV